MEFKEGVPVYAPDGRHIGKVDYLVVDPGSRQVTHVVIRRGHLLVEDKVAAVAELATVAEDRIVLGRDPGKLPPFEEAHYVPFDESAQHEFGAGPVPLLWGGWRAGGGTFLDMMEHATRNIPDGEVPVAEGALVEDVHGERVGQVLELITDPSGHITHLLVEAGHLWGKHRKAIPVTWASGFHESRITLAVGVETLDRVPAHQAG